MKQAHSVPSESRYYLKGKARWALIGFGSINLVIFVVTFVFCLHLQMERADVVQHPYFPDGNSRIGPYVAAKWAAIAALLGEAVTLGMFWRLAFRGCVILKGDTFSGIKVSVGGRRVAIHLGIRNRSGGRLGLGSLRYDDVTAVSEGRFLGCKFRRYHKKDGGVSIIVPYCLSKAEDCFALLEARVKSQS